MPDCPGGSSAEPTLYQTMWVTTGARWSSITTPMSPFGSVKLVIALRRGGRQRGRDEEAGHRAREARQERTHGQGSPRRMAGASWLARVPGATDAHGGLIRSAEGKSGGLREGPSEIGIRWELRG